MMHKGTLTLTTPRLVLRPFMLDDADDMYANWASDPEVTKFLMWPTHTSIEVSRAVLADWTPHYAEPDYYHWAITLDGHAIGSMAAVDHDDRVGKAHIGYCIGRCWWHQGIMSEALQAVMDFLFDQVGYQRIESRHDPRNPHSGGVMRKCGMKFEGTLRQSDWNNQGVCDACWYALLKSER
ncbi:MAG: GNAT family N-acetyltransferase [Clostridia bacterium]|nr:GNAT family N-acetyltransferase [Clostridia bacterium]